MIDIFDIENLPNELEVIEELWIFGSNWRRKPGDIVSVTYNIREEYWGKMSGQYYPAKVTSINIVDCDYPVYFFPHCFKCCTIKKN